MPLWIIKGDIIDMDCDAIVNPTNTYLTPGGKSVDSQIHLRAGKGLLDSTKEIGRVGKGQAVITPAFDLQAKYVIHTSGPYWVDGYHGEQLLLENCYLSSLKLAVEYGCESIAFPLISSGTYEYPKDNVMSVAMKTISDFLINHEINVYIVIYDKAEYEISKELFEEIYEYAKEKNIDTSTLFAMMESVYSPYYEKPRKSYFYIPEEKTETLEDKLKNKDISFSLMLMNFLDEKNMSHIECYKKANVSKQTWYKILNDRGYKPSKETIICFAIALKLNLEETNRLLASAGFILSSSEKFDIIIQYFIEKKEYRLWKINEVLFAFSEDCLGC